MLNIGLHGDFRIVGLVYEGDNLTDYLIYVEKNGELKPIGVNLVKQMFSNYKFINARLDDSGNIVCLDCDIDNLAKYQKKDKRRFLQPMNNTIYIISKLMKNKVIFGYKVVSNVGRVIELEIDDLIYSINKGSILANGTLDHGEIRINK